MNTRYPKIAKASMLIILLALTRCIGEFFRLEYVLKDKFTIATAKPFMIGAMTDTIGLFLMIGLFFYSKYKLVALVGALTIIAMLCVKYIYSIP